MQSLKNWVLEVYLESLICRNCMVKAEVLDAFLYRVVDENVTVGKINIHLFWFFGSFLGIYGVSWCGGIMSSQKSDRLSTKAMFNIN